MLKRPETVRPQCVGMFQALKVQFFSTIRFHRSDKGSYYNVSLFLLMVYTIAGPRRTSHIK